MTPLVIDDLIGIPFRLGGRYQPGAPRGREAERGLDCWGLVMECFRRRGLTVPDPFTSDVAVMAAKDWILAKLTGWVRVSEPAAGLVVELVPGDGVPAHVGYCLDAQRFLHVGDDGAGVIVSRLDRAPWVDRIVGFYDYR